MVVPSKDALLKAKSDITDPKTIAEIKKSIEKERKLTKKAVIEAVKVSAKESAKEKMESMEGVSKSLQEGMSEGFRVISESMKYQSESMKEAMQEIVSQIKTMKNIEQSPESQYTLPPAQHKFQQENLTQENLIIKPIGTNSQTDWATGSESTQEGAENNQSEESKSQGMPVVVAI